MKTSIVKDNYRIWQLLERFAYGIGQSFQSLFHYKDTEDTERNIETLCTFCALSVFSVPAWLISSPTDIGGEETSRFENRSED